MTWTPRNLKHGKSRTREFKIWVCIKYRCLNENSSDYKDYGAKGIKVCDRWVHSFENFLSDMGPRPTSKHTIERDNVFGDYEPNNCRWATRKEQANNRRNTERLIHNGQEKLIREWCQQFNLNLSTVRSRLNLGWTVERALNDPVRSNFKVYTKQ